MFAGSKYKKNTKQLCSLVWIYEFFFRLLNREFNRRCNSVAAIVTFFRLKFKGDQTWNCRDVLRRLLAFFSLSISPPLSLPILPQNCIKQSKKFCCKLLILFVNILQCSSMIYIFIYFFLSQFFRSCDLFCMRLLLSITIHLRLNSLRTS